jgi:hypothetical protein
LPPTTCSILSAKRALYTYNHQQLPHRQRARLLPLPGTLAPSDPSQAPQTAPRTDRIAPAPLASTGPEPKATAEPTSPVPSVGDVPAATQVKLTLEPIAGSCRRAGLGIRGGGGGGRDPGRGDSSSGLNYSWSIFWKPTRVKEVCREEEDGGVGGSGKKMPKRRWRLASG